MKLNLRAAWRRRFEKFTDFFKGHKQHARSGMFIKETEYQRLRDEHLRQVLEAYPIATGIHTRQTELRHHRCIYKSLAFYGTAPGLNSPRGSSILSGSSYTLGSNLVEDMRVCDPF